MPEVKQPFSFKPFVTTVLNKLFNATGFPVPQLAENDGTERTQLILHDGTVQRRWKSETTGEADVVPYGRESGGGLRAFQTENTAATLGRLMALAQLAGTDSTSTEARLRIDSSRILETHPYNPVATQISATMPAGGATYYTVPAGRRARVEIDIVNNSALASTVNLFVRVTGEAAGAANRILTNVPIAANVVGIRLGPFHLAAGGIISGDSTLTDSSTIFLTIEEDSSGWTPGTV